MENPGHDHSARISARYKIFSDPLVCALLLACLLALGLASAREREERGGGVGGKWGERERGEREMCVYVVKFWSLQGSHINHFLLPSPRGLNPQVFFLISEREEERVCFVVSLNRLGTTNVETRC